MTERELFEAALDQEPDGRAAFLERACAGTPALLRRLEALLARQDQAGSFLEEPALEPTRARAYGADGAVAPDLTLSTEAAGQVLAGRYKLLEQIGEGGMGTVWLAQQTEPVRRRVAVKLIKAGMDSRMVLSRFEAERQTLALMDHPNIAKVHDGGSTEQGRPFFVMEYVKGVPITQYCDQASLTVAERLELFVTICQAVQHAHQKGVIHRDLKPSNLLICLYDDKPVPKVIDFGLAKAVHPPLTDDTVYTAHGLMLGTPLYMSPEQAAINNLDVDTRSDIYSLGVVLYELLTGTTPLEKEQLKQASWLEMLRMIKETEPPRPSTRLQQAASGEGRGPRKDKMPSRPWSRASRPSEELDWIVMRALDKDRNRRYETASAFAADLERYSHNEPVNACPPSAWYRLRKFTRRNRRPLTMAAVVAAALVLAGGSIGWFALDRAAREAEIADDLAARQAETSRRVQESMTAARTLLEGDGPAVLSLARHKLAEADGLLGKDRAALIELAAQVEALDADLNRLQEFLQLIDRAHQVEILNATWQPAKAVPFLLAAMACYQILEADDWCGRLEQSILGRRQAEHIRRTAYEELLWLVNDVTTRREDHRSGQRLSPESAARQALAYLGKAEKAQPPIHTFYALRARCRKDLGEAAAARADRELADKTPPTTVLDHNLRGQTAYRLRNRAEGIKAFEAALRLEPTHFRSMMLLGACLCDLGEGAEDFIAAAIAFTGCIMKRPEYAHAYQSRANAYVRLHRWDEAEKDNSKATALDPKHVGAWISRGGGYTARKQWDKAVADYSRAIDLDRNIALVWYRRGYAYAQLGQLETALANYSKAIELGHKTAPTWTHRGHVYSRLGQVQKALDDYSRAIELDPDFAEAWSNRGGIYGDLGRTKEALADIAKAIAVDAEFAPAWFNRAQVYRKLGERQKAIADYSKCIELDAAFAPALNNRAFLYGELGQWAKAVDDYTKLSELTPKDAEVWNNRGRGYYRLKQWDNAITNFTEAIKLDRKNPLPWSNRGSIRAERGQFREALADLSQAVALDAKYVQAWSTRGTVHLMLKEWNEAIVDYSKAIDLAPKFVLPLSNRAFAYVKLGQWDKAVADLFKCLELEPKNAARPNELAWILATHPAARVRDPRRAVHLAKSAVKLAPKEGGCWNTLGVAHYRAGDWKAALEALNKSTRLQGENAVDSFFQAMAHWQIGEKERARTCYDGAMRLLEKNQAGNEELRRFRAEAAQLLGIAKKK